MRLVYPENGLRNKTSLKINDIKNKLYQVKSSSTYNVSSTFQYSNYVRGISGTINSYISEIERLESKIDRVDTNYSELESDIVSDNSLIEVVKIKERDRMIV